MLTQTPIRTKTYHNYYNTKDFHSQPGLYMELTILCWFALLQSLLVSTSMTSNCIVENTTLTCDHDLPTHISDGITAVYITDYNRRGISVRKHVFNDSNWQSVKLLDIIVNSEVKGYYMRDHDFFPLHNLTKLGFHSKELLHIDAHGLAGLEKLVHLDLSGCSYINSADVVRVIMGNTLHNLKELNLEQVRSRHGKSFKFNSECFQMLQAKSIKWLSLSGTNILLDGIAGKDTLKTIEYLDISNITYMKIGSFRLNFQTIPNVRTLNFSWIPYRYFEGKTIHTNISYTIEKYNFPAQLETLDSSFTHLDAHIIINNVTLNASNCPLGKLKVFHFKGNNLETVNATIHLGRNILTEINLSSNQMVYLSPNALRDLHSLKILILSNNSLDCMQNFEEFGDLLKTFFKLEQIDMAYNKLSFLPYHVFTNNVRLKMLKLNGNKLESITFKLTHLVKLEKLDLGGNRILFIDGKALVDLALLFQERTSNNTGSFALEFLDNPLECSCNSLKFITWLDTTIQSLTNKSYQCSLEGGTINIDSVAVRKSEYMCRRTTIMVAISVSVVVLAGCFIVMAVLCILTFRKKKQKDEVMKFLNKFKARRIDEKYLVFLSYCSIDGDLVLENVYKVLDNALKEMIGVPYDIVCNGEIHFKPGAFVISEMVKCIAESCVVIFVVSRAFCASGWCCTEVKEAYEMDKPVILIFKEHVDPKLMPQHLLAMFNRCVRVKLVLVNGRYELVPALNSVCDSVILLASSKNQQNRMEMSRLQLNVEQ